MRIWAAEIVGYDPSLPGTRTLYYATKGFTSTPADTPANTYFAGRLVQPSILKRDMFDSGTTFGRSRASFGDMVLANDDGALDVLIPYGFDGRSITVYCGDEGDAYPAGYQLCAVTTAEQVTFGVRELTFKLRGREFELEQPLQSTKYAGNNVLPDGLEGGSDLAGKPKPTSFGKVFNASAVLVNSAKLIYQVHDGAITEITDVRDRGTSLSTGASDWSNPTSGFGANTIYASVFAKGLFVNGGAGGRIYTSPDGSTWTSRVSGFGVQDIRAIGYGNGTFVAVGTASFTSTSTDGITWTARTPASGGATLLVVYYSQDQSRWVTAGNSNLVYYSNDDAVTWVNTANGFTGGIYAGAYAVIGGLPTYVLAGQNGELETSNDGRAWTVRTSGFGAGNINRVVRAPTLFFAAGAANRLYVSPDGITWSPRSASFASTVAIEDVFYADGVYIIAGAGGVLATSLDGVIFDNQTTGVSPAYLYQASRGVGLFVVVGTAGTVIVSAPSGGNYGSLAALQDDAQEPAAGAYFTYLAGGYFRLGSSPAGIVTCDYQVEATLPLCSAAAGFQVVMAKMGKSSGIHYSAADITALNIANSAPLGFFLGVENMNANAVLDEIAGSVGAWWGTDQDGIYRIQIGPNPTGTSIYTITTAVIIKNSFMRLPINDAGRGLPTYRYNVGYQKNYTIQTTDLAFGVSDEDRTLYEHGWLNESATVSTVQTLHALSVESRDNTLLVQANDAHGEAFRRLSLYSGERSRYEMVIVMDDTTMALDIGYTVTLTYPRFGLDAGVRMAIVMLEPNHATNTLRIGLWGGGTYAKYLPIYAVKGGGVARVLR